LFWTNRIPNSSVKAQDHFKKGASMDVNDLSVFDYFSLANALSDGNSIPATVSFSLLWAGNGTQLTIDDGSNFHFSGIRTTATVEWTAAEAGFSFTSDPASTTTTNFALVGDERNGVFYASDA
jgi:hypothetical protein